MTPLDRTLGGGIRAGELILIGGAQGSGKTTMSLQIARNIAQSGQANVLYICFEHDEEYLLNRMMAMESALAARCRRDQQRGQDPGCPTRDARARGWPRAATRGGPARQSRLRPAIERINRYGQKLFLMRGSHTYTRHENLRALVEGYRRTAPTRPLVVFVDYLQQRADLPRSAD